jgi:cytochrome c-type biogenesis protein CcmH/NrfF
VLLLIGAIAIALIVRRHRGAGAAMPLDAAERKRLQALLREADRAPGRDDSGTGKR